VRVRNAQANMHMTFAIGEAGQLFSWGHCSHGRLGHGDTLDQPSPKRIEALRGVRVSSVEMGWFHSVALTEDGQVYAWGTNWHRTVLGDTDMEEALLPKPVEALRGVRVGSIAVGSHRSYALADTGQLWAWGAHRSDLPPLGNAENAQPPRWLGPYSASSWMRWWLAITTLWRWRMTEACTRGATRGQRNLVRSAWAV
jgi:alpha-tubulin suppressor-like RCC1 family protein